MQGDLHSRYIWNSFPSRLRGRVVYFNRPVKLESNPFGQVVPSSRDNMFSGIHGSSYHRKKLHTSAKLHRALTTLKLEGPVTSLSKH